MTPERFAALRRYYSPTIACRNPSELRDANDLLDAVEHLTAEIAALREVRAAIADGYWEAEAKTLTEFGAWAENRAKAQRFLDALAAYDALAAAAGAGNAGG